LGQASAVESVPLIQGSTLDKALLIRLFEEEKPNAVIDFAAYKAAGESVMQPHKYFRNNLVGPLTLLETMLDFGVKHYIFSSSCAVFGTPTNLPTTEDNNPLQPTSPYGQSKLMVEQMVRWFEQPFGLKHIALRYFNAAGASLDTSIGEDWDHTYNLIPLVMKTALGQTDSIKVFGTDYPTRDGSAIRDYIHVVDLARAHVQALTQLLNTGKSNTYNLGSGKGNTVLEVIETAKQVSGVDFKVELLGRRLGDPAAIWADNTKAQRELGWQPNYDLHTIIKTAWDWHRTQLYSPLPK
jgi:UDP-glucose-4-epimerase GalE